MTATSQPWTQAETSGLAKNIRKAISTQEFVLLILLVVLIIAAGTVNPRYWSSRNMIDILAGNAYIAIAAIGASMVIITGNIDISVGSLIGVMATIAGTLAVQHQLPSPLIWLMLPIIGAVYGAFIGWLVAYLKVPSIVVTLGFLSILKGGLILTTGGQWIKDLPASFFLAQARPLAFIGGEEGIAEFFTRLPMPVYFMIVLTLIAAIWMRYSATGRAMYAVGGNAEAAWLSGISQKRIVLTAFILNGVFVGISGVMYATQLTVIQSAVPPNLELFIITAAVVGGVSILGGSGTVVGAMLAAILLNAIRSAMVFIDVSPFWLKAVQGGLILVTVLVDLYRRRQQLRSRR